MELTDTLLYRESPSGIIVEISTEASGYEDELSIIQYDAESKTSDCILVPPNELAPLIRALEAGMETYGLTTTQQRLAALAPELLAALTDEAEWLRLCSLDTRLQYGDEPNKYDRRRETISALVARAAGEEPG